jgi:hypothetical protein
VSPSLRNAEIAALGALSLARSAVPAGDLVDQLVRAGVAPEDAAAALEGLRRRALVDVAPDGVALNPAGVEELRRVSEAIARALDNSPTTRAQEECPSVPLLTTVETEWVEAVSVNYAVEPARVAPLLPHPLEVEVHAGSAWVQVLVSSLREMRPQGLPPLFGVCFYQVSYRAAVQYRSTDGSLKRGGFFVRSETNNPVMRAIGMSLKEFAFHEFGAAEIVMLRDADLLTVGVTPEDGYPLGRFLGIFDTRPLPGPPAGSVWGSLEEASGPLVECYDAFGVDEAGEHVYVLTIDRQPWEPRWVKPVKLYSEWMEEGPLAGATRLDSVLHIPRCRYKWRPLRREPVS